MELNTKFSIYYLCIIYNIWSIFRCYYIVLISLYILRNLNYLCFLYKIWVKKLGILLNQTLDRVDFMLILQWIYFYSNLGVHYKILPSKNLSLSDRDILNFWTASNKFKLFLYNKHGKHSLLKKTKQNYSFMLNLICLHLAK